MDKWIWGYSDKLSARAGETVTFFLSATGGSCDVEISRLGATRESVWRRDGIAVGRHAAPEEAHIHGCGWPEAFRLDTVKGAGCGAMAAWLMVVPPG